jgi:acetyl esterase
MPLHAEARALLDLIEQIGAPELHTLPPAEARAAYAAIERPVVERCHATHDLDADGVPVRLYEPSPADDRPGLLVFLHGGGWVFGSLDTHDALCHALARRSGHAVLAVDYRLAPETPFPGPLEDCLVATEWARDHADELGIDPHRIAVGGDSAGGNLAAVVAQVPPIPLRFQLLVYPATDLRAASGSYAENAEGYFLSSEAMHWFIGHYLAGEGGRPDDPRVSPLLAGDAAIAATPPALVITAGFDPLRDEGIAYADRLAEAGVVTSLVHFPGQIHGFFPQAQLLSDARSAQVLAAHAIAEALAPTR